MADAPEQVRIRSYNVGFGDCFLLTFTYARGRDRNALIDFGSSEKSTFGPRGGMVAIAEQIGRDCGGKLDMVVATHRHSDHISGFGGRPGEVIRDLEPDLVVQPWTEDPDLEPQATGPRGGGGQALRARAAVARLSDMQALAAAVLDEVPRLEAVPGVPRTATDQLRFLGETNIRNADAVRGLIELGRRGRAVYARFGTRLPIARVLPGVKVAVLGPPTLEQSAAVAEAARVDADQFWHLGARRARAARGAKALFEGVAADAAAIPQEARWVIPKIDAMHAEEMLAIVRILDRVLNNTSVILTLEFGRERLVFPGDAQIENWRYALFEARSAAAIRERLKDATFYKVGHHGSLNATPKSLWNAFANRSPTAGPARLATMVSTLSGKHGKRSRGTEVPRGPLVEELERMSEFRSTQDIRTRDPFWVDVVLPR